MGKVMLANVRLAFPDLWEPRSFGNGDAAKFGASLLFPPDHPAVKLVNKTIEEVAVEKWGTKAQAVLKGLRADGKVCLHDGDAKPDLAGYPGNMYISARTPGRPLVIDRDKSVLTATDGRPYGGCYVNAQIEIWAQDSDYGKRVNAALKGIQFLRDGEAFAGGAPADPDDFEELDTDETAVPAAATAKSGFKMTPALLKNLKEAAEAVGKSFQDLVKIAKSYGKNNLLELTEAEYTELVAEAELPL